MIMMMMMMVMVMEMRMMRMKKMMMRLKMKMNMNMMEKEDASKDGVVTCFMEMGDLYIHIYLFIYVCVNAKRNPKGGMVFLPSQNAACTSSTHFHQFGLGPIETHRFFYAILFANHGVCE